MVTMAAADGEVDEREASTVVDIYRDVTGRQISETDVIHAAKARSASDASLIAELCAASGRLDRATKEQIIRAAYLVLLADNAITTQERKTLRDIADALKIPEVHFGAIMEDLAIWLSEQGR
jgi:DnaJ-domain-containing protein 1